MLDDKEILELDDLISGAIDDRLSPPEYNRLRELLSGSAEARRRYVQLMQLSAGLRSMAERSDAGAAGVPPAAGQVSCLPEGLAQASGMPDAAETAAPPIPPSVLQRLWSSASSPGGLAMFLGVVILLIVGIGVSVWHFRTNSPGKAARQEIALSRKAAPQEEATSAAVAVLLRAIDVKWARLADSHNVGSPLLPGWLKIRSGLVQIAFHGGAIVTLEGPAELKLISGDAAFCACGRLSAEVPPPTRGFRVTTPQVTVEDMGTAFGLDVTARGSEVDVFKGEVALSRQTGQRESIREGEGVVMDETGKSRRIAADRSRFKLTSELERRQAESVRRRIAGWQRGGREFDADPALLAHFDFEGGSPEIRTLRNSATQHARVGNGAVVGCNWCEGRWLGKGALEFRSLSDRVRLSVPGEYKSLTLVAWICVYGLDCSFNSLMMSDGFPGGAVHWQILHEGTVRVGLSARQMDVPDHNYDLDSPVVFTPERMGQWVQLAVVIDGDRREIRHYVDGEMVNRLPLKFDVPLRIGEAQLGNWDLGDRKAEEWPIRRFSGRMDEFLIFARPLGNAEVRELFVAGAPHAIEQNAFLEPK